MACRWGALCRTQVSVETLRLSCNCDACAHPRMLLWRWDERGSGEEGQTPSGTRCAIWAVSCWTERNTVALPVPRSVRRRCHRTRGRAASTQELLAVHDPDLVGALEEATAKAGGQAAGVDEAYGFSLRRK